MKFFLKSYACPAPSDITAMLSPSFRYIHPLLEIPANIQPQNFPSSSLSVIELLEFPLPLISATTCKHAAASFFSSNAPTVDLPQDILKIVVPPAAVTRALIEQCKIAALAGKQSIRRLHLPSDLGRHLTMWIVTYWAEVLELCQTV
jgi:hypothetical protein